MTILRCGLCGEPIGQMMGDPPTPAMLDVLVARCYQCAAVEAAEKITASASEDEA